MKKKDFTKDDSNGVIKKVLLILGGLLALIVLSYFLSLALINRDFERQREERRQAKEDPIAQIQYEEILAGSVFNNVATDYYVLIYDFDGADSFYAKTILDSYKGKEGHKTIYTVNLNNAFNNYIKSDTSNSGAKNASELAVSQTTLINIKNGKIVSYIEGVNEIKTTLQ